MIYPDLCIDFLKFAEALREVVLNPTEGVDTYTAAARKASGLQDLELTVKQRGQCKQAGFGALYGMGTGALMEFLKKK